MERMEINIGTKLSVPIVEKLYQATGDPIHCILSLALQVITDGGIEAHAKTMSPDSVWISDIYPKIKD